MKIIFTLFFFYFITSCTYANVTYTAVKDQSNIGFTIEQFGLGLVTGKFHNYEIKFFQNEQNKFNIIATINVKSLKTGNKTRDRHLQKKEFFNTKKYESITFKTTKDITFDSKIILGELTLKGVTSRVELPVTFNRILQDNEDIIQAYSHGFEVLRSQYNMTSYKRLINNSVITKINVTFEKDDT